MLFNNFVDFGRQSVKTGENDCNPDVNIIKTLFITQTEYH